MSSKQPAVEDSLPPREVHGSLVHTEEENLFSLPQSEGTGQKSVDMKGGQQPLPLQEQVRSPKCTSLEIFNICKLTANIVSHKKLIRSPPPSLSPPFSLPSLSRSLSHPLSLHPQTHTVSVGLAGQARTTAEPAQTRELTTAEGAYRATEATPSSDYE